MIDYLDVTIPFTHNGNINNGYKYTNRNGETSNRKYYSVRVKGRKGSSIQIVSVSKEFLRITGNPAMFIQGQNVFGTDNLNALTYRMAIRIAKKLGVTLTSMNKRSLKKGDFDVHRIDLTNSFVLPSQDTVCEWLDKSSKSISSLKQKVKIIRSSTAQHSETIILGEQSSYISSKFYNKYEQMKEMSNNKNPDSIDPVMDELIDHTKPLLRSEIRLHNQYLKRSKLTKATSLTPEVMKDHFFAKHGRTSFGSSKILPIDHIEGLTKNEKLAYQLWLKGGELKSLVSPSTFARLRNSLLKLNLDINRPFVDQVEGRDLDSYLKSDNIAEAPDFLVNTPWLFDPD